MAQEEELIRQESYFWNQCVALRKPPKHTEKADLMLKSIQGRYGVQENKQIVLPPSYAAKHDVLSETEKTEVRIEASNGSDR